MKKYTLSGFFKHFELYKKIILTLEKNPQWKYEDVRVDTLYDSFPNVIFNGGRIALGDSVSPEKMEEVILFYNSRGIGINYTFTNSLITRKHIKNNLANYVLKIAHNKLNGVITSNPVIYKHIKKNFPKYNLIYSCSAMENNAKKLNKIKYNLFCISPSYNRDYGFINKLDSKKVEILLNEKCMKNCPYRKKHYLDVSKAQLTGVVPGMNYCKKHNEKQLFLNHKDVEILYKMGIENFKLIGRSENPDFVMKYIIQFLIKKQYVEEFEKAIGGINVY